MGDEYEPSNRLIGPFHNGTLNRGVGSLPTPSTANIDKSGRSTVPTRDFPAAFYDLLTLRFLGAFQHRLLKPMSYLIQGDVFRALQSAAPPTRGPAPPATVAAMIAASRPMIIDNEHKQWTQFFNVFWRETADSKIRPADRIEHGGYMVVDLEDARRVAVTVVPATLPGTVADDRHMNIPFDSIGTAIYVPGTTKQVIGLFHTHYFHDPAVVQSTSLGYTERARRTFMVHGVSEADKQSALENHIVVYALDSRYLHRADPDGSAHNRLARRGDLLREALRFISHEPARA